MKNSNELLEKFIQKSIEDRLEIAYFETKGKTKYDEWTKESTALSKNILELLGENKELFAKYEELISSREDAFLNNAYFQGFKDGLEILRGLLTYK